MTQFSDLGLAEPVLRALAHEGYDAPTPIQAQAIPPLLEGKDLLGIAQTGTGKTAAFALPILDRLSKIKDRTPAGACRVLVLAPTRELAAQIGDSFRAYGRFLKTTVAVVVGGVAHGPQIRAITPGVDVLVATPGRLLDHVDSGKLSLKHVEVVVLDEADHMLDLGFLPPIRRIVKMLPKGRQNLFFSATMPEQIGALAGDMLTAPVKVSVTPVATTQERVDQSVYLIEKNRKRQLLAELLDNPQFKRTLVFTRTKRGADRVARHLEASKISAAAIHGNKSQNQRERALNAFKDGQIGVLVATDIAARGIDVDGVTHVVNFELPNVPESYVHRIGRTARGGASGTAIAFCDEEERGLLRDIERTTRQSIPVIDRRDAAAAASIAAETEERHGNANGGNNGRSGRSAGGRNAGGRGGNGRDGGNRGARGEQGGRPGRAASGEARRPAGRTGNGNVSENANAAFGANDGAAAGENTGRYKGGIRNRAAQGPRQGDGAQGRGERSENRNDNRRNDNRQDRGRDERAAAGRDDRGRDDARDPRGPSAKKVPSDRNRRNGQNGRDGAGADNNRIASNLSFLGGIDERRTTGNDAKPRNNSAKPSQPGKAAQSGKPSQSGKPAGRQGRPAHARSGQGSGQGRSENNSGNRSRRERA